MHKEPQGDTMSAASTAQQAAQSRGKWTASSVVGDRAVVGCFGGDVL